jgi:hypothetical protein
MSYSERNIYGNMAPEFSNVLLEKYGKNRPIVREIKKYCIKSRRRIIQQKVEG